MRDLFLKLQRDRWLLLYAIGYISLAVASALMYIGGQPQSLVTFLLYLGVIAIALGFAIWVGPHFMSIWNASVFGKVGLTSLHWGVGLLAIVPARILVAQALGLPPQDFDLTVAFVAAVMYVPVWTFVLSWLALAFYVIALFAALLPLKTSHNTPKRSPLALHAVSSCILAVIFLNVSVAVFAAIEKNGLPIIRLVSYFADFHLSPAYPGVIKAARLRLHENGVVSYAELGPCELMAAIAGLETCAVTITVGKKSDSDE